MSRWSDWNCCETRASRTIRSCSQKRSSSGEFSASRWEQRGATETSDTGKNPQTLRISRVSRDEAGVVEMS